MAGCASRKVASLLEADKVLELHQTPGYKMKFVDGSWHMNKERNPYKEFADRRIVGAQYFNIDDVSDKKSSLPHMIPSPEQFEQTVSSFGVSENDHVVVYVTEGCPSAARVWWMFRLFGHDRVSILNGGLPAWVAAGGATESGDVVAPTPSNFKSKLNPDYVASWQNVLAVVNDGSAQIVDARSMPRFLAEAPEPRPGLIGGHIPGSLCIPFTTIVHEDDVTRFRSVNEIKDVVMDSGVILGAKCIFSCGSGVTAAVVYFAMHLLGIEMSKLAVYDGSWTEWAQNPDLPKIGKK
eukprot:gene14649-16806_t